MSRRSFYAFSARCRSLSVHPSWHRLIGAALLTAGGMAVAADPEFDRQKAEFTVNFAKFAYWPPGRFPPESGKFTLCQFRGSSQLARALAALEGRTVQGFPIEFRRLENLAQAPGCMLLFTTGRPPQLRPSDSVLTVGSGASFAQQGGMIGLLQDGARLRFEINLAAMQRSGIVMSSQVLSLASNVIDPSVSVPDAGQQPWFLPATTPAPDPGSSTPPAEPAFQPPARGR